MRMYHPIFWTVLGGFFRKKQEQDYTENTQRMSFKNDGRSGMAFYHDGEKTTAFYTEAGGGNCIFYMVIPSAAEWESQTGYPLARREDILKWIAEESLKKQTQPVRSYYTISDRYITFYNK
ncbi:MAG: hypothetical protein IPM26_08035 [Saprospiraceae bacterium]|nr:hypothetical protein [Saprospiraceae bacterium]